MFRIGTKSKIFRFSCYIVFAAFINYVPTGRGFFEKGIFYSNNGNTLWDELYEKCGDRVSFYCVQNKLMNYINNTLDSNLYITDSIYFVKNSNIKFNKIVDSNSPPSSSSSSFSFANNGSILRKSRAGRTLNELTAVNDNSVENGTYAYAEEPSDDDARNAEEEEFVNVIRTIEKAEDDSRENEKYENSTSTLSPFNEEETTASGRNVAGDDEATPSKDNLVIRSLNKVSDILYDKTTDYLSTHDLRLDLPNVLFGGSKIVVSPRGYDEDGGIILKLNFNPAETSRAGGFAKFFHKMFKKKLLTSFLALLLIIKLIKIKLMYVLPVIIGVNAAKKILLKSLLFLFPPLVHLFKLCTYYHAHASKLHFHHHKIKHHHHHIKVPVPVPVPVQSHKPHHHHGEYGNINNLQIADQPEPTYESPSYGMPEYYTRNDMTQHGDELASWGLKDFYVSSESPGVLSAQAQAYSPFAEQNYLLQAQPTKQFSSVYKDPLAVAVQKNKLANSVFKTKSTNHGSTKNTFLIPFDSFYTPILQKIDSIFTQLGFNDEGCRERLICSMYKNPVRFSPHSNLLSTELSRDPAELERPSQSNVAAIRFYRYVEAARDGQSQKDCLLLYPECVVKTE